MASHDTGGNQQCPRSACGKRRSKIQSCALKTSGMIVPQFGTCHYAQLKDANETAL
jgi:hypothetical protein